VIGQSGPDISRPAQIRWIKGMGHDKQEPDAVIISRRYESLIGVRH